MFYLSAPWLIFVDWLGCWVGVWVWWGRSIEYGNMMKDPRGENGTLK